MRKFADFICKHQKLVIFISCILLVLSFIGMNLTKINYDILVYLPEDIETIKGENILTDDFEIGSYSLALVENLNSKDILKLENDIKNIDGVNNVFSIYDAIGTSIPLDMLPSDITSKVHNENTDLLIITFADSTSSEKTINAVKEIRELKGEYLKQGGMSSMVVDTMNLSESEIFIYIVIAVILCIFILELSLDSYVVPFILLMNIGFAILFNLGTNVFLGEISYITKALVVVLQLGVTTDFSIFLYHSYEKKKEEGLDKTKAMTDAIVDTFSSVTGSSLTTIAGFLVLCTMQLTLGKDLGIVMAKGVLFGVICVLTLFPALLLMLDNLITKTKHKVIVPNYTKLNTFIIKHKNVIFAIFIILLIPIYLAYSKVDVYYKLDRSLPSYLESIKTNQELKDNYNIVSPELILVDSSLKTDDFNNLVQQIEATDGIEWVLSLAKLNELGISKNMLSDDILKIVENENYDLVLVNSSYETATDELNNQITQINKIVKSYDKKGIVAGEGALMKDLVTICDTDFHNVNTSSIICIFIILFIVLKSLSLPFLLIITIEFAIFMNMSFSYFGGVTLPFIAPIVLGTIQLGATIDYAILMTTTYLRKRKEKKTKEAAMLEAMNYCGNSIFTSGMCFFAATFGVGVYSKIEMIGALCTLIARGAIISMLVVIMVLPSILLIFDKLILKTKLKERKDKKMKNSFKKKAAAVLSLLLIFGFTFNPILVSALTKNETVYAKLNEDGTVKSILVSEELKNDSKKEKLEDYTNLTNILNVSNDKTFEQDGNKLTWNADGKDIFYQGTTEEKLPISLDITYKLNDKEEKVDDMLGKSGKVEITLKFTNHDKHNGLYTPFVITTGMILDNENNSNIKINNGKVIANGTKNVIVGISSPGLYESLKIKELKEMDKITISYDTTKFELASIYNVITPKLIENSDLDVFTKMDNIYKSVDTLGSNMDKIDSASKEVANGSKVLKSSLETAINKLKESSSENTLSKDEINKIKEQTLLGVKSQLTENSSNGSNKEIQEYVTESVTNIMKTYLGENFAYYGGCLQKVEQACSKLETAGYELEKVQAFQKDVTEQITNTVLKTSMSVAESTASSVVDSLVPTLANQVKSTTINTLTNSLGALYTGIDKLDNGINELSKGISTFNEEGIKKVTNLVNSKVKGTSSKVKELIKLSNNYDSFTTDHNLNDSSTKFILVIDGKNAPKEEKVVKEDDTKITFWDRVTNLFK